MFYNSFFLFGSITLGAHCRKNKNIQYIYAVCTSNIFIGLYCHINLITQSANHADTGPERHRYIRLKVMRSDMLSCSPQL